MRKAAEYGGVEHRAARLGRNGHVHDVLHGLAGRRVHERARHHWTPAPYHRWVDQPVERAQERAPGALAGLPHVDVRIGAIAGDDRGVLDHRRRHVRVEIQAEGDGQPRRDGADPPQQLPLSVVEVLGHHGAVKRQECRVTPGPDRPHDGVAHVLVGGLLDVA